MLSDEDRIMSERRPQGPPPTPRNPTLESKYAALDAIADLGSDDPAETFQKPREPLMYTGETSEQFAARRKPFEAAWAAFIGGQLEWELRA